MIAKENRWFVVISKPAANRLLPYDKLVISTGAKPNMPPIPGIGLDGITTLLTMADTDYLRRICDEKKIKQAVVIGGGLIGVETCEALQLSGIKVTVVEALDQVLTFLDWDLAKLVENHMRSKGVQVFTSKGVTEFIGRERQTCRCQTGRWHGY